jgi:hypothetical protein
MAVRPEPSCQNYVPEGGARFAACSRVREDPRLPAPAVAPFYTQDAAQESQPQGCPAGAMRAHRFTPHRFTPSSPFLPTPSSTKRESTLTAQ